MWPPVRTEDSYAYKPFYNLCQILTLFKSNVVTQADNF